MERPFFQLSKLLAVPAFKQKLCTSTPTYYTSVRCLPASLYSLITVYVIYANANGIEIVIGHSS